MKYQKPKCDCGSELIYVEEVVIELESNITAKGNISKKKKKIADSEIHTGNDWFKCPLCINEYEVCFKSSQIIKGELR